MSRRLRGDVHVPLVTACAIVMGGCAVAYHPLAAHAVRDGDVGAKLISIETQTVGMPARVTVNVDVDAPTGDRVTGWLTSAAAPPCAGGISPALVLENLNRDSAWQAGRRELQFEQALVESSGLLRDVPAVLDVEILPADLEGKRACLRVPVAGTETTEAWRGVPSWFIAAGVRGFVPSAAGSAIGSGWLFTAGGGVWLGPVRLRLDGVMGGATTSRPPPAGSDELAANLFGGALSAEAFFLRFRRWGLGVQIGYDLMVANFEAKAGSNTTTEWTDTAGPRGPRAALRLARLPWMPGWPSFRTRSDAWSIGVDLYASRWTGIAGDAAFHFGVALGAETGRWW